MTVSDIGASRQTGHQCRPTLRRADARRMKAWWDRRISSVNSSISQQATSALMRALRAFCSSISTVWRSTILFPLCFGPEAPSIETTLMRIVLFVNCSCYILQGRI